MQPFLSHKIYMGLPKQYLTDPVSEFMPFGEWFVRNYLGKKHDPELFYERNMMKAGSIIGEKYLEKNDFV